jgi:hypothetical protein
VYLRTQSLERFEIRCMREGEMDILLLISLLMCMAASLPATTSMRKPYSHTYSDFEGMVEEGESMFSSMDGHDKRDLDALLYFRKAITSDPLEILSNWMTENSQNICPWYGIRCRQYTRDPRDSHFQTIKFTSFL